MSPSPLQALPADPIRPAAAVASPPLIWETLCARFHAHIAESNILAGERLWTVSCSKIPVPQIVISSTRTVADYVDVTFERESSSLKCSFGPAIGRCACEIKIAGEPGESSLTADEAASFLLNALIFPDTNQPAICHD